MSNLPDPPRKTARITCMVHQRLNAEVIDCLKTLGAHTVLVENARCVRQRMRPRFHGLPGLRTELIDDPFEIFRTTVSLESAETVLSTLAAKLNLHAPGRGTVFAQHIEEISLLDPPIIQPEPATAGPLQNDLTLITGILSMTGSGESLARAALKLGAGVPVISLGAGTGIRDRLGLLRITIPPEKELVHLVVPSHDAATIQRLLIEECRMNRPGGGFLYQTPVAAAVVDPLIRIGPQEHAATLEQIIAAVDELKKSTAWRKRFAGMDAATEIPRHARRNECEISFICAEGDADRLVQAALCAGAGGTTTSRVRCLLFSDIEGGIAARERGILCVPQARESAVLEALRHAIDEQGNPVCRFQLLNSPVVFSHQST